MFATESSHHGKISSALLTDEICNLKRIRSIAIQYSGNKTARKECYE